MKIAVVTGASSGLGKEFVKQIADKYDTLDEIWVLARRIERLEKLQNEILDVKLRLFKCDLTNDKDIQEYESELSNINPSIYILVNAAGYGMIGKFDSISEDNIGMLEINCKALTNMLNISIPFMSKEGAHIINIASSAGFLPQPSFAVYAATKSYVLSLSRALNKELKSKKISVCAVCPGPVETEFFDIAEKNANIKSYKNLVKATPDKVVKLALKDADRGKDVSVYGTFIKAFRVAAKILPHKLIIKFIN